MGETKLFIGSLPYSVRERDLEDLFRKYGTIVNFTLKTSYGFVEYEDPRDARDAVRALDGYRYDGTRIVVEYSQGQRSRDKDRYRDRRDDYGRRRGRYSGKYSPPHNTKYRISVTGLPTGCNWKDLKDHFRQVGEVCFSDVRRDRDGRESGIVDFKYYEDLKYAVKKFDRTKMWGSTINIHNEYFGTSHSRSKSKSGSRSRKRSASRSPRRDDSRSRSPAKSSRSPYNDSPPRKRDQSRSPRSSDQKRSRSRSPKKSTRSRRRSRSKSPPRKSPRRSRSSGKSTSPRRSSSREERRSKSGSPKQESPQSNRVQSPKG